jgi:hypothetical protein
MAQPCPLRQGVGAGERNFPDADLFTKAILKPLAPYSRRVACLMLEFGTLAKGVVPDVEAFTARFGPFLEPVIDLSHSS